MKLESISLEWALTHVIAFSDTDLFPTPVEFDVLEDLKGETLARLEGLDLGGHMFSVARRFIVPKDELSYRTATQLDPLDNIILTAIVHQYGDLIEQRRLPVESNRVFSYRFDPQANGSMYRPDVSWIHFWETCREKSKNARYVVYIDIADFYNQIYHHTVENQLIESGVPNAAKNWVMGLLENLTVKVSRGIPVGPHCAHLLAEMALIPIDNSMVTVGLDYCRYVDDIYVFCESRNDAQIAIYRIADILDKQGKLIAQKQKTIVYSDLDAFRGHCASMLDDQPINLNEERILKVIRWHSTGRNPYEKICLETLEPEELALFDAPLIASIFDEYLKGVDPDYTRLRWFLRRLAQVGVPTGVDYCIDNIQRLMPAISDVCHYMITASRTHSGDPISKGGQLLTILEGEIVKSNEYFQLSILNLFARKSDYNHLPSLVKSYPNASPSLRRKIILAAFRSNAADWIRELKEAYSGLDAWGKRAYLIACSRLPVEERKFFLAQVPAGDLLTDIIKKWALDTGRTK